MILRRIGVLSCGKVMGVTYAVMGFIFGAIMALASMMGAAINQGANAGNAEAMGIMAVGVFAIVLFPILYGIGGFIGGVIMAAVYNLVAGMIGGLEMEFEHPATTFTAP